jgi:hypothetical protein
MNVVDAGQKILADLAKFSRQKLLAPKIPKRPVLGTQNGRYYSYRGSKDGSKRLCVFRAENSQKACFGNVKWPFTWYHVANPSGAIALHAASANNRTFLDSDGAGRRQRR